MSGIKKQTFIVNFTTGNGMKLFDKIKNNSEMEVLSMNEVKGIQESLLKMIDAQFNNAPSNITQIVKMQNNEITLKEWQMRIPKANSISEVESIITTKENG